MRKLLIISIAWVVLIFASTSADAKEMTRYATKTVELKQAASTKSRTIAKAKTTTRLTAINEGKTWTTINYKGATVYAKKKELHKIKAVKKYTGRKLRRSGVITWKGCRFTWYSQRVLPGRGLKIPGRHADKQGFICDKDNYIVVASTRAMKKKRTIVPTPFGKYGKCYDCGAGGSRWRDVYVAW